MINQTETNMTNVDYPYVLRANGASYSFPDFASLMGQVRTLGLDVYEIECLPDEDPAPVATKTVRNLMSGKEVEIAVDTPLCCDPSKETYWCM